MTHLDDFWRSYNYETDALVTDVLVRAERGTIYRVTLVNPTSVRVVVVVPRTGSKFRRGHVCGLSKANIRPVSTCHLPFHIGDKVMSDTGNIYRVRGFKNGQVEVEFLHGNPSEYIGNTYTKPAEIFLPIPSQHEPPTPVAPEPQASNPSNKENNMDTNHVIKAINDLAREEAATAVRPVYDKVSVMVRKTKPGNVLRVTRPDEPSFGMQFYCHLDDGGWLYGNGSSVMDTETLISRIVQWTVESKRIKLVRLTKEGK